MSWSEIGATLVRKGTHLASEELDHLSDKAKAFSLALVGFSIGFLIFYVGVLLKLSELGRLPPSSVLLGGGFFLMLVASVLAKRRMNREGRKMEPDLQT